MGFEISYPAGRKPTNSEILAILREQYPGKEFTIRDGVVIESYISQPPPEAFREPPGIRAQRLARKSGERATAAVVDSASSYLERTMSNSL